MSEQKPEPVAWYVKAKNGMIRACWTAAPSQDQIEAAEFDGDTITPLYTSPRLTTEQRERLKELADALVVNACYEGNPRANYFEAKEATKAARSALHSYIEGL